MTKTTEERTKELAEAMKAAALADEQQHNNPQAGQQRGLIGGNYLWGLVASRIITMMEEVAREAVDQWLNSQSTAKVTTAAAPVTPAPITPPRPGAPRR